MLAQHWLKTGLEMPGWLHRHVANRLAGACPKGTKVLREHPIRVAGRTLFADLVVQAGSRIGVVEVERSADRVGADIDKACAFEADFLLIATPDRRTATAVTRALRRGGHRFTTGRPRIVVAPYAAAITALRELLTVDDSPVVSPVNKSTTTAPLPGGPPGPRAGAKE